MFIDGDLYLSEKYKLSDYIALNLNINGQTEVWEKAINIFISRINGRYFNAINKLSNNGNIEEMQKYGFSIMSIECLLIDTLVKFRYGPIRINNHINRDDRFKKFRFNQENKIRFMKFLSEFLSEEFVEEKNAEKFYKDIRCGIVHFGSTENMSRLTCDSDKLIKLLENGDISVDVNILYNKLERYFQKYINDLKDINQRKLRENFIITMNYLCLCN